MTIMLTQKIDYQKQLKNKDKMKLTLFQKYLTQFDDANEN